MRAENNCSTLGNFYAANHNMTGVTAQYDQATRTLTLTCADPDYWFPTASRDTVIECNCTFTTQT